MLAKAHRKENPDFKIQVDKFSKEFKKIYDQITERPKPQDDKENSIHFLGSQYYDF